MYIIIITEKYNFEKIIGRDVCLFCITVENLKKVNFFENERLF